ncbi:MAG: two-component system response regulator CreB [Moraxellaceae bacterium]|jgi:two-component system catabolic regulation response regulator CreB|nr:two-component system response regulator CreB [Moraxellaceae bacterium]
MAAKPRILVVEDEPGIADAIRYVLESHGFEVTWRQTGGDALADFARQRPDLVVLDVGLPDISGFDLFRQLRATGDVPVIFLTARSDEIDRVVGLELGADDYIAKPFSPRELAARVRTVLRRTQAAPAVAAAPGVATPFVLDDERRQIRYYGQLLDLSRYEFGILRLLLRHPGRVYTREEIMYQVWEVPEVSSDRTVDTHIKVLRAKLKAIAPAVEAVCTHRGVGYSLAESCPAVP